MQVRKDKFCIATIAPTLTLRSDILVVNSLFGYARAISSNYSNQLYLKSQQFPYLIESQANILSLISANRQLMIRSAYYGYFFFSFRRVLLLLFPLQIYLYLSLLPLFACVHSIQFLTLVEHKLIVSVLRLTASTTIDISNKDAFT